MSETVAGHTAGPTSGHELDASPWMRVESTLMATARLIRDAYDNALDGLDVNLTEASLLAYVVESGPLKQTSLADHLAIGRAATGNVIDRLEQRGLVERRSDESDRRVWLVAPTELGKDLAAQITTIDVELRQRLRLGIDRHERQMLASLLVRLQRNLAATPAARSTSATAISATQPSATQPPSSHSDPSTTDRKRT